jgi:acyl-CoA dehydrogenase
MNEILGRSYWAPTVFGTAAPDTGNAEILALHGTEEQKERYLAPLLAGDIVSCFSMTEPQAGADPKEFTCQATRDGEEWVIDGHKWFSSNARYASFFITMVVTNTDARPHERMSMFIVPAETPGIEIIRNVATVNERDELDEGTHGYIHYNQVRLPLDAMLGAPGEGFKVAQSRLGGGRVHHAMRVVGKCQRAFDMMCERALSRRTQGKTLAEHQFVQGFIADSALQLQQFRLLVLQTAWIIDTQPHGAARKHIAMCKVALAQVLHDVLQRALHLHGSLGTTHETPLAEWFASSPQLALADGPT